MFDKLIEFVIDILEQLLPFFIIHQYEEGVHYRFGKYLRNVGPGLNWKLPLVDSFSKDIVTVDTMRVDDVNITTLDGKTVTIGCEFDVVIVDIYAALNDTHEWRGNLKDVVRGIMSDYLEEISWEDIKKKTTKNAIEKKIEKRAKELGASISNFNFTDKIITKALKLFNTYGG